MIRIFNIASLLYLIIITIAFLIPVSSVVSLENQPSNSNSYAIHSILLFLLHFLFYLSFKNKNRILIFCIMYSLVIEVLQIFTLRGFQFSDIAFNILGVLTSFLFFLFLKKIISIN